MIKSISIKENTDLKNILFFDNIKPEKITLLFGANGVGKSSLINAILNQKSINVICNKPTNIYSYINSKQNFRNLEKNDNISISMREQFMAELMCQKWNAGALSEGQSIIYSIQDIFMLCDSIKDDENDSVILLDEIDSGLSLDNVEYLAKKIKNISKSSDKIQFIISFNNYEFCRTFKNVFNMYTGEWIKINGYDEYRTLIKGYRQMLLKKRKRNMFTGNSNF